MDQSGCVWISFIATITWFSGVLSQAPDIILSPLNQVAYLHSDIMLRCKVSQNAGLSEYLSWEECISHDTCRRISNDNNLVYAALGGHLSRQHRYSIGNSVTGQYELNISGINMEDAGIYRCMSRNDFKVYSDVHIVILASEPECTSNITEYTGIEMDTAPAVYAQCTIIYNGTLRPSIQFIVFGQDGSLIRMVPADYSPTEIGSLYSLVYSPKVGDHGANFTAFIQFNASTGETNMATNRPDYTYIYQFGRLTGHGHPMISDIFLLLSSIMTSFVTMTL